MSGIQIISSAGAGSQTLYGGQTLTNIAQGFIAGGLFSFVAGIGVTSPDLPARSVVFDFVDTSQYSQRFDFTPQNRPFVAGGLASQEFGGLVVENESLGIMPSGLASLALDYPRVSFDVIGRNVAFDFTVVHEAVLSQHFIFSGPQLLTSVGGEESATFGSTDVDAPLTLPTQAWDSLVVGWPLVSEPSIARSVVFDFAEIGSPNLALHFNFSGPSVLAGRGSPLAVFGAADVANGSQGAIFFGHGVDSLQTPYLVVAPDLIARSVAFEFNEAYTPGSAANIGFNFGGNNRRFIPGGLDSFSAGTQYLWGEQHIKPFGFQTFAAGEDIGTIWLIYPQGWDSFVSTRYNGVHLPGYILGHGFDSSQFGSIDIPQTVFSGMGPVQWGQIELEVTAAPVDQFAEYTGFSATQFFSDSEPPEHFFVSHEVQVLRNLGAVTMFEPAAELLVSSSPQHVYTPFDIRFVEYGRPQVTHGIVFEFKSVKTSTKFGTSFISHPWFHVLPSEHLVFGAIGLTNAGRPLRLDGIPSLYFGQTTTIHNAVSYLRFEYYCQPLGDRCGATFGQYGAVYNRNFTVRPNSLNSLEIEYHPAHIKRAGRAILFSGFDATLWARWYEPQHMVAYYERAQHMTALDSLVFPQWTHIKNAARVFYPDPLDQLEMGWPALERMLTKIFVWGRAHDEVGGISQIGDALQEFPFDGHGFNSLGMGREAFVAAAARPLSPEGVDSFQWATIRVVGKPVPAFTPWWPAQVTQDLLQFGRPAIRNWIKEISPDGVGSLEMRVADVAWLSHAPRTLEYESFYSTGFGRSSFRDSTHHVSVIGFQSGKSLEHHNLWHDPAPVPPLFDGVISFLGFELLAMGEFDTPRAEIKQFKEVDFFRAGYFSVMGNSIIFTNDDNNQFGNIGFGQPSLFGGRLEVTVGEYDGPVTVISPAVVSPHTIWCMEEIPQAIQGQAERNHPGSDRWTIVDSAFPGGPTAHPFFKHSIGSAIDGPWFGKYTTIWQEGEEEHPVWSGVNLLQLGMPVITLGTNYIAYSDAVNPARFGFPEILTPSLHTIKFRNGPETLVIGTAGNYSDESHLPPGDRDSTSQPGPGSPFVLTILGPREAVFWGLDSFVAGPSGNYENFHRYLSFVGSEMTLYEPRNYAPFATPPIIYHYPRGPKPAGQEFTDWGEAWLSHSPRWVNMHGADTLSAFATEWKKETKLYNSDTITIGFIHNEFWEPGDFRVSHSVARIGPYGIGPICPSPGLEVAYA